MVGKHIDKTNKTRHSKIMEIENGMHVLLKSFNGK
jgi:hypothetical protein